MHDTLNDDQKRIAKDLRERIDAICAKCPQSVIDGDYATVVNWKTSCKSALTAANKPGASISYLTGALANMERFK